MKGLEEASSLDQISFSLLFSFLIAHPHAAELDPHSYDSDCILIALSEHTLIS